MYKVTYKDGNDDNKEKVKIFKTREEAIGFKIVSWYEYHCFDFRIEEEKKMYESDKVIGTDVREAIKWIEAKDLWGEVIEIESDATGIVTNVIH